MPYGKYWWVAFTKEDKKGNIKIFILGPFNTENEAEDRVRKFNTGDYSVVELPTKDKTRASSMIKAQIGTTERMRFK